MRHFYVNFKLRFKDKTLRNVLWAERACRENEWGKYMDELKSLNNESYGLVIQNT